jgi:hypothetical protein
VRRVFSTASRLELEAAPPAVLEGGLCGRRPSRRDFNRRPLAWRTHDQRGEGAAGQASSARLPSLCEGVGIASSRHKWRGYHRWHGAVEPTALPMKARSTFPPCPAPSATCGAALALAVTAPCGITRAVHGVSLLEPASRPRGLPAPFMARLACHIYLLARRLVSTPGGWRCARRSPAGPPHHRASTLLERRAAGAGPARRAALCRGWPSRS